MHIIFWQKIISPHQSSFLKALAKIDGIEVSLVVDEIMDRKRLGMGWEVPEMGRVNVLMSDNYTFIRQMVINSNRSTYHIFSGINYTPALSRAFILAIKHNVNIGIMAESYDWHGVKGRLRYVRSIIQRIKYNGKIDFILAIGNKGIEWFKKTGYSEMKIFEWGYFIDPVDVVVQTEPIPDEFNVVFVGSLFRGKGVDILIEAASKIKEEKFQINIVGEGPEKQALVDLVKSYNMKNITFLNFMQNEAVQRFIRKHDLLVLPSRRKDGWGAVVNEALMQGTPVVCSESCGASVLLCERNYSDVFESGNAVSLADTLRKQILRGKLSSQDRQRIVKWSECINGDRAASYFLEIVNSNLFKHKSKPVPPWEKCS
ncbi:glycosyltransferase family 4 protein [Chitinophaga sp. 212800010-3]|uniref:glycosyltransferase family 4 protein n=1 Tax=unclassified Chitinophaga TaxID=2619133 RepID=UPI002DF5EC88|nr:hypothetical protein [Chitinophaga sp. 212800010-3]